MRAPVTVVEGGGSRAQSDSDADAAPNSGSYGSANGYTYGHTDSNANT